MLQVTRFMDEACALRSLLSSLNSSDFQQETGFKDWTVNDVIRHLFVWNKAAEISATGGEELDRFLQKAIPYVMAHNIRGFERDWAPDVKNEALLEIWWASCEKLETTFNEIDPKARLKWAGPDMSARSSITARLMETWAHGQALYDMQAVDRPESDGLKDIADLGVRTFAWTFKNRKQPVPDQIPYVSLVGPDGERWEWGDPASEDKVQGAAMEFCQVVTQARNVEDTNLMVDGQAAQDWMAFAQCFAGPPETPPGKGARG